MPWFVGFVVLMSASGLESPKKPTSTTAPASTQPTVTHWPHVEFEDLVFLVKTARRSFEQKLIADAEFSMRYRPPMLRDKQGIIHAALRLHGSVIAEAQTTEMNVIDAANAVGQMLAQAIIEKRLKILDGGRELGLEFEWLGPREFIPDKFTNDMKWTEGLLHSFEPAVEGIGVELDGRQGWTRPSEIITNNYSPDLALLAAEDRANIKVMTKSRRAKDIRYFRFPGVLLWQPRSGSLPVWLQRGERLLADSDVNANALDSAIDRLSSYIVGLQKKDGSFVEEYIIGADANRPGVNGAKQISGAWGLATWAEQQRSQASINYALAAVRWICSHVRPVSQEDKCGTSAHTKKDSVVVDFEDQQKCLESTARLFCLLSNSLIPADLQAQRGPMRASLLASQANDGHFAMSFVQPDPKAPEDIRGGAWALMALAQESDRKEDYERVRRSQEYYRGWLASNHDKCAAETLAVLARAFAQAYEITNDARTSEACYAILDYWTARQLDSNSCPWPELNGAISAGVPGVVGVDTASYLLALADGVKLAQRIGDRPRSDAYREAIRKAARFLLQLQFSPDACFYIRFPQDVVGAVRSAPWDHRIRVEYCADALMALIRARQILFGEPIPRPAEKAVRKSP